MIRILVLFLAMFINLTAQAGDWQKTNIAGMDLWLYIPSGNVHSLMVSLHGCDQTPDDLKVYGNWTSSADSHNMIVAIPWVPNGGVIFGCWDYYGSNHTRTNRDNGPVIDLTEKLISDKSMNIDPNQVYISGVSSGGTQALIEACLRPDLYAGVGVNSGAALGTNAFQTAFPPSNGDSSARICKNLAGDLAGYLETQITSIIVGSADVSVNPKHSLDNGEAMSSVYGATKTNNLDTSQLKGRNNSGIGTLVTDAKNQVRVSYIVNNGLNHAWASGELVNGKTFWVSYATSESIDYPSYLTGFLSANNLRSNILPTAKARGIPSTWIMRSLPPFSLNL